MYQVVHKDDMYSLDITLFIELGLCSIYNWHHFLSTKKIDAVECPGYAVHNAFVLSKMCISRVVTRVIPQHQMRHTRRQRRQRFRLPHPHFRLPLDAKLAMREPRNIHF